VRPVRHPRLLKNYFAPTTRDQRPPRSVDNPTSRPHSPFCDLRSDGIISPFCNPFKLSRRIYKFWTPWDEVRMFVIDREEIVQDTPVGCCEDRARKRRRS
jgi:hypothetical protein